MTETKTKKKSAYDKTEDAVIITAIATIAVCWTVDLVKKNLRTRRNLYSGQLLNA